MTLKSTVGSGALVVENGSVLLVQLNYGRFKGQWILPGGLVESGENPAEAAQRELKEETNQVGEIVAPHSVRYRKDPADVYWVFIMKLQIQREIKFPAEELQNAKFWSIETALESQVVRPMTKYFLNTATHKKPYKIDFPRQHIETDTVYFFTP